MRKINISGPISGMEDGNRAAFDTAERLLRESGYEVFNPHDLRLPMDVDLARGHAEVRGGVDGVRWGGGAGGFGTVGWRAVRGVDRGNAADRGAADRTVDEVIWMGVEGRNGGMMKSGNMKLRVSVSVLREARECASWHDADGDHCGNLARHVMQEIDQVLNGLEDDESSPTTDESSDLVCALRETNRHIEELERIQANSPRIVMTNEAKQRATMLTESIIALSQNVKHAGE